MDKPQDTEAAETGQTTNIPAADLPQRARHFCRYCGRPLATEEENEAIEPEGGDWLCWREWGGDCIDIQDAFERVWSAAVDLAQSSDPKPWRIEEWKSAKEQILGPNETAQTRAQLKQS